MLRGKVNEEISSYSSNTRVSFLKDITRLSYYNVTTRLVDLVGLCWFKQNLV